MATIENLIPGNVEGGHKLTLEEQKAGGIASGKARQERKKMREMLEACLKMTNSSGKTYQELATLGLLKGAMNGNPAAYRTILETLGELGEAQEDKKAREITKVEELLAKVKEEADK